MIGYVCDELILKNNYVVNIVINGLLCNVFFILLEVLFISIDF